MPILTLLAGFASWLVRPAVMTFIATTMLYAVLQLVLPLALNYLSPFLGTGGLDSSFSGLDAGTWFFLDIFGISYGLPLCISAWVARFLIRRIPVIG